MTLEVTADATIEALLAPFPTASVRGKGGVYSFREAGTGPALVLLHGIGSASASWARQLAALGRQYRTVAWDAPGYGGSSPLAGTPRAADYAAALADFLDAVGIRQAHVVGHSLGALMAAAFARGHSERIARLALASPAGGYARAEAAERERRARERLAALAELGPTEHARRGARRLLGPAATAEDSALVEWSMERIHPEGYAQAVRMLAEGDIRSDLATWERPLLVISGTADAVTPEASCRAIAVAAKLGRYRSIAGAGHALHIEAHADFDAMLLSYLAEGEA